MRYKGVFNYHGQDIILWTHARDKSRAFSNFILQLVSVLEISRLKAYNFFKGQDRDNYLIEEKEGQNADIYGRHQ